MEIAFAASGFGIGVRSVNITFRKRGVLYFLDAPDEASYALVIQHAFDGFVAGPNGGFAAVLSDWVPLNACKDDWLFNPLELVGKQGRIEIPGTSLLFGDAVLDLQFRTLNEHHRIANRIHLRQVPVKDGSYQIGGFSVSGTIREGDSDEAPIGETDG